MEQNELSKNARGGTELLMERLHQEFPHIEEEFQIIPSRVRSLDPTRKRIYYVHDLPNDPEVQFLRNGGWQSFKKLVFVSHWQQQMYNVYLGVPYDVGVVIPNSIKMTDKDLDYKGHQDQVNLIYFSTPHRGLDILYEAFKQLYYEFDDRIHLNVFSSFDLYGWPSRDKPYKDLFKLLKEHEGVTYSKSVSNDKLRKELRKNDVLAYPSTWVETSCLCLIEAMAHNLSCVHSSLGALPETSGMLTNMYQFTENKEKHVKVFTNALRGVIENELNGHRELILDSCERAREVYSWDKVKEKWEELFDEL